MKRAIWIVAVVMAALGGFVAGRGTGAGAGFIKGNGPGNPEANGSVTGLPSKSDRTGARRGWWQGGGRSSAAGRPRADSIRELIDQQRRVWDALDPFADTGPALFDASRLHAAIHQASEGDFPALLEAAFVNEEEGVVLDYAGMEALGVMLRRWCDFDPRAAMAWLADSAERLGDSDYEAVVAAEAIDTDPDWALAQFAALYRRAAEEAPDDPFGPTDANLGGDSFFHRMTMLHPERALEAMRTGPEDFWQDGHTGWMEAMFALGRGGEIPGLLAGMPDEVERLREYGRLLPEFDPAALSSFLDEGKGDTLLELEFLRREEWGSEAWLDRVEWFLERSGETEERVIQLARTELGTGVFGEDADRRDEVLGLLEQRGVDVAPARETLFWMALNNNNYAEAFTRLDDVPAAKTTEAMEEIFAKSSRVTGFTLGGTTMEIFRPREQVQEAAVAQGLGDAYESFLVERNAETAQRLLEYLADPEP